MMKRPVMAVLIGASLLTCSVVMGADLLPVSQPGVCQECHTELENELGMRHVHAAFEDGECSGCHNPHASSHDGLLQEKKQLLCLECHSDLDNVGKQTVPHPPAANGNCLDCHHPHASANAGLLPVPMIELCQSCHADVDKWATRNIVHDPVADGDCMGCHAIHGSDQAGMVRSSVPGLCFECHDKGQAFSQAHSGRDISQSNCIACHDPHSSDDKGLLRTFQHDPFESGNCSTCHQNLDQGGSFAQTQPIQEMCLKCHRGVGSYTQNSNTHILDSEGSCTECHNPHASNAASLLNAKQGPMCLRCHFNDKEDKSAWLTHSDVDCTECHAAHGNDDPQLINTRSTNLCGRCHEAAHSVTHPVGDEVIDPRTDKPVNCLSCHQMHGARFVMYLPLDPNMELCVQCHKQ